MLEVTKNCGARASGVDDKYCEKFATAFLQRRGGGDNAENECVCHLSNIAISGTSEINRVKRVYNIDAYEKSLSRANNEFITMI